MFLDFYQLREQPFGVSPDPHFLYLTPTHREALASLYYGIESGLGFLGLIAPPGMGKTTLLFHLLEQVRKSARTAFIFETQCDSHNLLRQLLADFNADEGEADDVTMHLRLNELLINEAKAGRRVVVVIDEAHNLNENVLEWVRLLSNFETPSKKLLQIILAGQPPLADKLARSGLTQLYQRISIVSRLDPLTRSESSRYIEHRLRIAGYPGSGLFKRDALALISSRSEGIPRVINTLCFNALSLGYAQQRKSIHSSIVEEVLRDLDLDQARGASQLDDAIRQPARDTQPAAFYTPSSEYETSGYSPYAHLTASALSAAGKQSFEGGDEAHRAPVQRPRGRAGRIRWLLSPAVVFCAATLVVFYLMSWYQGGSEIPKASASSTVQPTTIMVVVQPHDTLEKISEHYLGRFDADSVREIRKLNPQLADVNRIQAGEQIRLPRVADSGGSPTKPSKETDPFSSSPNP